MSASTISILLRYREERRKSQGCIHEVRRFACLGCHVGDSRTVPLNAAGRTRLASVDFSGPWGDAWHRISADPGKVEKVLTGKWFD